jgi:hypothetical protein
VGGFNPIPARSSLRTVTNRLRFLDLTGGGLGDMGASSVLQAAIRGGVLQGLELAHNNIGRAQELIQTFARMMQLQPPLHCTLAHLGLSHNQLGESVSCHFLSLLQQQNQGRGLMHLDLSNNEIRGTPTMNESLKHCLLKNSTLRVLDLSNNHLRGPSFHAAHSGMKTNKSMLLLGLAGNHDQAISMREYGQIAECMRRNRQLLIPKDRDGRDNGLSSTDSLPDVIVPEPADVAAGKICALFAAPLAWESRDGRRNPVPALDYQSERYMLWELFREAQRDVDLRFDFLTKEKLQSVLTYGVPALHLSLHGHPQFVLLENGESGVHWLKPSDVTDIVRKFGGDQLPKLVFVSACHSLTTGQAFVDAGVRSVVSVKVDEELNDASANIFTRAFYLSLAVGR